MCGYATAGWCRSAYVCLIAFQAASSCRPLEIWRERAYHCYVLWTCMWQRLAETSNYTDSISHSLSQSITARDEYIDWSSAACSQDSRFACLHVILTYSTACLLTTSDMVQSYIHTCRRKGSSALTPNITRNNVWRDQDRRKEERSVALKCVSGRVSAKEPAGWGLTKLPRPLVGWEGNTTPHSVPRLGGHCPQTPHYSFFCRTAPAHVHLISKWNSNGWMRIQRTCSCIIMVMSINARSLSDDYTVWQQRRWELSWTRPAADKTVGDRQSGYLPALWTACLHCSQQEHIIQRTFCIGSLIFSVENENIPIKSVGPAGRFSE